MARKAREKRKSRAERVVAKAIKTGGGKAGGDARPRHVVRIYTSEDGNTVRSRSVIRSWGELFDIILENERNGVMIEEIYVEAHI